MIHVYFGRYGGEMNLMNSILSGARIERCKVFKAISIDIRTIPRAKKAVYLLSPAARTADSLAAEHPHSIHILFYEP